MDQTSIASLRPGDTFLGFLLVRSADKRLDKRGTGYLDMNLADRTGEMNCKVWNGTVEPPAAGSVVKVQARIDEYNGRPQMRVERFRTANSEDDFDMSLLVACAPERPETMLKEITDTIDRFASNDLKRLVMAMLGEAGDALNWFPAAQRMHHAERSGLLHHTTGMLRTAEHIIAAYPFLNGDLLRAGVILHDLAKIDEMKSDELGNVTDYTQDGCLIGHLVRGVARL